MAMASSQQTFFSKPLPPISQHRNKASPFQITVCRSSTERDPDTPHHQEKEDNPIVRLAVVALAAGVLVLGPIDGAAAAKSGGRVGGQAFRSSVPRASAPRINNSRTNVFINPPVAPPLVGGYGYGMPFFGGGWGWSPFSFFTPGPSVAIGVGGGFEFFAWFLVLGAVAAVIRSFTRPRNEEDENDY